MSPSVATYDVEGLGDLIWFAFGSGAGTLVSISREATGSLRQAYKSQIEGVVRSGSWPSIEKQMLEFARAAGLVAAATAIGRGSALIENEDLRVALKTRIGIYVCPIQCVESVERDVGLLLRGWTRTVAVLAGLQVCLASAGIALSWISGEHSATFPFFRSANLIAFAISGLLLVFGSRSDSRARILGIVFLLIAAAYSYKILPSWPPRSPAALELLLGILASLHTDAFLPACVWLFVREFPRALSSARLDRTIIFAVRLCMAAGFLMFASDFVISVNHLFSRPDGRSGLAVLWESSVMVRYWAILYGLMIPALPVALWKARHSTPGERQRVSVFLLGLLLPSVPVYILILIRVLFPGPPGQAYGWLDRLPQLLVLLVPVTTAYSVLVDRVLDVRLIIRRALQYALARYTVLCVVALPFTAIAIYLFAHRQETLARLLTGPRLTILATAIALGYAALKLRGKVLNALDRRFFREQYDSQQILADLVDKCRQAENIDELAEVLGAGIQRALHPESVVVLCSSETYGEFVSPQRHDTSA